MAWVAASLVEKLKKTRDEREMCRQLKIIDANLGARHFFFCDLPHKGVSLVLEDAYFLYRTVWRKGLLQHLLAEGGQRAVHAAHIHGAIGGTALVVDLIKGQRLDVLCKKKTKNEPIVNECLFFCIAWKFISISQFVLQRPQAAINDCSFLCLFRADIAFILPASCMINMQIN